MNWYENCAQIAYIYIRSHLASSGACRLTCRAMQTKPLAVTEGTPLKKKTQWTRNNRRKKNNRTESVAND